MLFHCFWCWLWAIFSANRKALFGINDYDDKEVRYVSLFFRLISRILFPLPFSILLSEWRYGRITSGNQREGSFSEVSLVSHCTLGQAENLGHKVVRQRGLTRLNEVSLTLISCIAQFFNQDCFRSSFNSKYLKRC